MNNNGLIVPHGGSAPIYGNLFTVHTYNMEDIYAQFYIVEVPRHGEIIFQKKQRNQGV